MRSLTRARFQSMNLNTPPMDRRPNTGMPLFLLLVGQVAVASTEVNVLVYWPHAEGNHFEMLLDGQTVCTLAGHSPGVGWRKDQCSFEVPVSARALEVRGQYMVDPPRRREDETGWLERFIQAGDAALGVPQPEPPKPVRLAGSVELALVDGSELTAPMRDLALTPGTRWRRALAAEADFAGKHALYENMAMGEPVSPAELAATEKMLGFELPAGYVALMQDVGHATVSDHSFLTPEFIMTGRKSLLDDWGLARLWGRTDQDVSARIAPALLRRMDRSVALFEYVGDGLGMWLYVAPPEADCGNSGGWLWMHQDSADQGLEALEQGRLRCISFDEVLREVHYDYVYTELMDELADRGSLLLDHQADRIDLTINYGNDAAEGFKIQLTRR